MGWVVVVRASKQEVAVVAGRGRTQANTQWGDRRRAGGYGDRVVAGKWGGEAKQEDDEGGRKSGMTSSDSLGVSPPINRTDGSGSKVTLPVSGVMHGNMA